MYNFSRSLFFLVFINLLFFRTKTLYESFQAEPDYWKNYNRDCWNQHHNVFHLLVCVLVEELCRVGFQFVKKALNVFVFDTFRIFCHHIFLLLSWKFDLSHVPGGVKTHSLLPPEVKNFVVHVLDGQSVAWDVQRQVKLLVALFLIKMSCLNEFIDLWKVYLHGILFVNAPIFDQKSAR